MTLAEIKQSPKLWLTPADIAEVLESDPADIRDQAQANQAKLGFPVVIVGKKVKIPRRPFLSFFGE